MKTSAPYKDKSIAEWGEITKTLVSMYPLNTDEILNISITAWERLWNTKVGETIALKEVELPATVVGYFFQKLFAQELSTRYPDVWRGESLKADKDLENIKNSFFSTEMKSSGQLGYKVFGNRSYCQKSDTPSKAKSGYYITINFYGQTMTLVSIGWIDKEDWNCQEAESGQAATLSSDIYAHKLIKIHGAYQLDSPIQLLDSVGPTTLKILEDASIHTFRDIMNYSSDNTKILKVKTTNDKLLKILEQYL